MLTVKTMSKGLSDLQNQILKNAWFFCDSYDETDIFMVDILLIINPELQNALKYNPDVWTFKPTNEKFVTAIKRNKCLSPIEDDPESQSYFEPKLYAFYHSKTKKEVSAMFSRARVIANKSLNGLQKRNLITFERINPISQHLSLPDSDMRDTVMSLNAMMLFEEMMARKEENIKKRSFTYVKLTWKGLRYCFEKYGLYNLSENEYERLLKDNFRESY